MKRTITRYARRTNKTGDIGTTLLDVMGIRHWMPFRGSTIIPVRCTYDDGKRAPKKAKRKAKR